MQLSTLDSFSELGQRTALHSQGFKNPDLGEENLQGTLSNPHACSLCWQCCHTVYRFGPFPPPLSNSPRNAQKRNGRGIDDTGRGSSDRGERDYEPPTSYFI